MKKVCLFNFPEFENPEGYEIRSFDFNSYFNLNDSRFFLKFKSKWKMFWKKRLITTGAEGIDKLYREKDPQYMAFIRDFVATFKDYDLIVMSTFNPVHPEVLHRDLPKPIKILGFIDDPYSTYIRGIPYMWAFDGAFYISQSYSKELLFKEALEQWGSKNNYWWPLCPMNFKLPYKTDDSFFRDRDKELVYVGLPTANKTDRLIKLKQHFKDSLSIYGRWPLKGYSGIVRGLLGRPVYWGRVRSLTLEERTQIYFKTKIGLNMHLSLTPTETGNMRMYEVPAHGMMLLCDKAARDSHELIYKANEEAVFYENFDDAISKVNYYLKNDQERIAIAKNGFNRFKKDYVWEQNLQKFLAWALSIKR